MNHLYEAKELKNKYPKETEGFSVFEVERIWEDYSESFAAGWMEPDEIKVKWVFEEFRFK